MMDLMEIISETLRERKLSVFPGIFLNCRDNSIFHSCPESQARQMVTYIPLLSHRDVLQININDKTSKKLINFPQIFQLAAKGLPSFRNCLAEFLNVQSGLSSYRVRELRRREERGVGGEV